MITSETTVQCIVTAFGNHRIVTACTAKHIDSVITAQGIGIIGAGEILNTLKLILPRTFGILKCAFGKIYLYTALCIGIIGCIVPLTAAKYIVSRSTAKCIVSCAGFEGIVSLFAREQVIPFISDNQIDTGISGQRISVCRTDDIFKIAQIVAPFAFGDTFGKIDTDTVTDIGIGDRIDPGTAVKQVISQTAGDKIISLLCVEPVGSVTA